MRILPYPDPRPPVRMLPVRRTAIPESNLTCRRHGLMMPMPDWGGRCWYCAFDEAKARLAEFRAVPLREDET